MKWQKILIRAAILLAATLFIVGILAVQQTYHRKNKTNPEKSVVEIIGTGNGNGVIWEIYGKETVLVTAAHVLENRTENLMINENSVKITDWYISQAFDLAFVKFEQTEKGELQAAERNKTAFESLQAGDELTVWGIRGGQPVSLTGKVLSPWIYMEDFGCHMLWGELKGAYGGLSGSGVFNAEGILTGILCGGGGEDEIAVLPFNIIETEWKNSGLAY